ncbi:MAG: hypothetical protein ACRDGM_18115 [bacterium]
MNQQEVEARLAQIYPEGFGRVHHEIKTSIIDNNFGSLADRTKNPKIAISDERWTDDTGKKVYAVRHFPDGRIEEIYVSETGNPLAKQYSSIHHDPGTGKWYGVDPQGQMTELPGSPTSPTNRPLYKGGDGKYYAVGPNNVGVPVTGIPPDANIKTGEIKVVNGRTYVINYDANGKPSATPVSGLPTEPKIDTSVIKGRDGKDYILRVDQTTGEVKFDQLPTGEPVGAPVRGPDGRWGHWTRDANGRDTFVPAQSQESPLPPDLAVFQPDATKPAFGITDYQAQIVKAWTEGRINREQAVDAIKLASSAATAMASHVNTLVSAQTNLLNNETTQRGQDIIHTQAKASQAQSAYETASKAEAHAYEAGSPSAWAVLPGFLAGLAQAIHQAGGAAATPRSAPTGALSQLAQMPLPTAGPPIDVNMDPSLAIQARRNANAAISALLNPQVAPIASTQIAPFVRNVMPSPVAPISPPAGVRPIFGPQSFGVGPAMSSPNPMDLYTPETTGGAGQSPLEVNPPMPTISPTGAEGEIPGAYDPQSFISMLIAQGFDPRHLQEA